MLLNLLSIKSERTRTTFFRFSVLSLSFSLSQSTHNFPTFAMSWKCLRRRTGFWVPHVCALYHSDYLDMLRLSDIWPFGEFVIKAGYRTNKERCLVEGRGLGCCHSPPRRMCASLLVPPKCSLKAVLLPYLQVVGRQLDSIVMVPGLHSNISRKTSAVMVESLPALDRLGRLS